MTIPLRQNKNLHNELASFLLWTLLFAIAFSQSPLYTSNQNQYFLHGFAQAGIGYLKDDWLANTQDPTPLFTILVRLTVGFVRADAAFYVFYALLMGVYLFGLMAIAKLIVPQVLTSNVGSILLLALLFLVHSAGLRYALIRLLGANWAYPFIDGVADQRMLGLVFQPSVFDVLLLVSMVLFLQDKPYLAVLSSVLAATIHATYVLPAAMLTLTFMLVTWKEKGSLRLPAQLGAVGLVAIAPVLVYSLVLFSGTSSALSAQARHLLVNYRIPHHTLISQWLDVTVGVKLVLIAGALYIVRKNRLFLVMLIPTLLGLGLTLVQAFIINDTLGLLFPWRISVLIVPLAVCVILAWLVNEALARIRSSPYLLKFVEAFSLALILVCVLVGGIRFWIDYRNKHAGPDQALYAYVRGHVGPSETYLIPVKMQDFRLETGAPAYVDFKCIPYKDVEVLEWYRRNQVANRFYEQKDCALLPELIQEGISHVVIPAESTFPACPGLTELYQDQSNRLFAIKAPK